jgi:hypothetical protein
MAARLQAATASDKPILLRLESGTGHGYGFGTTNIQQQCVQELEELGADVEHGWIGRAAVGYLDEACVAAAGVSGSATGGRVVPASSE